MYMYGLQHTDVDLKVPTRDHVESSLLLATCSYVGRPRYYVASSRST